MKQRLKNALMRRAVLRPGPRLQQGLVVRLDPVAGYGFIRTVDGLELYFGRENVPGSGFAALRLGCAVAFVDRGESERSGAGLLASRVCPLPSLQAEVAEVPNSRETPCQTA